MDKYNQGTHLVTDVIISSFLRFLNFNSVGRPESAIRERLFDNYSDKISKRKHPARYSQDQASELRAHADKVLADNPLTPSAKLVARLRKELPNLCGLFPGVAKSAIEHASTRLAKSATGSQRQLNADGGK
jgi:hypothetical protein